MPPVDLKSGSLSITLEDDLSPLSLTEREWEFKKDKRHPDGWTMDEIIRYVCKKCGASAPAGSLRVAARSRS